MRKETQAGGDLRVQGLAALFFSEAIIEDLNLKKNPLLGPALSCHCCPADGGGDRGFSCGRCHVAHDHGHVARGAQKLQEH